ncbi:MAG: 30S ribosomal protein S14 [Flavobacteriales bacterium]|jgi:small subunit ribosomal protein S14|nr:30S ribosomal protein S14 [Flavobacteriales bacterium]
MAKLSSVKKNQKRQKLFKKYQNKRQELKDIIMDKDLSVQERFEAQIKLSKLPRNSAKIRIRNRCNVTGRPRGYYRDFGISRIALRELSGFRLIPGVVKSSW